MKPLASITSPGEAALVYAGRYGWRVFPVSPDKRPLTAHGRSDATTDQPVIRDWFDRWPRALAAVATGAESGVVAIDVDVSHNVHGPDSLEELGVAFHPATWSAHSPSGGFHLLFRHPDHFVKTVAGKLGPGLDVRGDGGSLTLPPGPGRFWDPHLRPDLVDLAPFPNWGRIPEPAPEAIPSRAGFVDQTLSRYGEAAIDGAVDAIVKAPAGQQEATLNRECFSIGQLVGGGVVPAALAEDALKIAAAGMPSYDRRRPWNRRELDRKIQAALFAGMREPRRPADGCRRLGRS
jgi:hypothetical protein